METQPMVAPVAADSDTRSYVDWPAIFAGAFLASAISAVLLVFGSALGLSMVDFDEGHWTSFTALAVATGLWLIWVQVGSLFAGGYLAGRLRRRHYDATESESDVRDGSHGLLVWAVAVVISGLLAFTGAAGTGAVATVSASTVAAGAASNPDTDMTLYDGALDRFLRGSSLGERPIAADGRAEIGRVLTTSLDDGALADGDRAYLAQLISTSTGIDEAAAQERVNALWSEAQAAQAQALAAAERARKATLIAAFLAAASLFVAGAAAYFAATLGGKHRDQRTEVVGWYRAW